MSSLSDKSITIYEAMQHIKNDKYVMPAFQRDYVWHMEQIEKLWDSILLGYPIATFLFWHLDHDNVTNDMYFCNFRSEVTFDFQKKPINAVYELSTIDVDISDTAVLDGQQRLTSLYLSLFGETNIRPKGSRGKGWSQTRLMIELDETRSEVDEEEYNSKKHDIRFTKDHFSPTQFELRRILDQKFQSADTRAQAIENAIARVSPQSKDYARELLQKLCGKVYEEKLIRFVEIQKMEQDDALEMFVRFNSWGKPLKKTEIMTTILTAYWPNAKNRFDEVLVNMEAYVGFGADFVIRSALFLYGDSAKSFLNMQIAEDLKNNWNYFKKTLKNVDALLKGMQIDVSRFSNSWNVLLPIVYSVYYDPDYREHAEGIRSYLIRAVLFQYFSSSSKSKLQQLKRSIMSYNHEITKEMLDQIPGLSVTEGRIEDILNAEKGSKTAANALYFLSLDWRKDYHYAQDHLHPSARFDRSKPAGVSPEDWKEWRNYKDKLPNLQLLEGRSNDSKNDMPLLEYFNDMNDVQKQLFYVQAVIPENVSLEIKDFGTFYRKRRELLAERIRRLLG